MKRRRVRSLRGSFRILECVRVVSPRSYPEKTVTSFEKDESGLCRFY
jgi:hypothetical protein